MPEFRIANPIVDREILDQARQDAFELVAGDPFLRKTEHAALHQMMLTQYKNKMQLIMIG